MKYKRRGLPGKPFVTARVTPVYSTGVCIYFYFAFYYKGISNPQEVYLELENMARDEILKSGGSLSHHHGVGKLRRAFLPRIMSETAIQWKHAPKKSLDIKLSTKFMSERSMARISVSTPLLREHSAATSARAVLFLAIRTRLKPPAANSNAKALPIPEDAPVMMAHLALIGYRDPDCLPRRYSLDQNFFSAPASIESRSPT